jgi:hypothetical protein
MVDICVVHHKVVKSAVTRCFETGEEKCGVVKERKIKKLVDKLCTMLHDVKITYIYMNSYVDFILSKI